MPVPWPIPIAAALRSCSAQVEHMPLFRTLLLLWTSFGMVSLILAQNPLGNWQDHLPYRRAISVAEGGGSIYCASTTAVFRYHMATGEIERITKANALSDVGIQGLAWNQELGMLLVYYANGNLDLLQGDRSFNMGDIRRSSILGNKGIYSVYMEGTRAYLGCGFGIVLVDLARREVRETWFIGPSGSQVQVNGITIWNDSIYAATNNGLFTASANAPNLAAFSSWARRSDMPPAMANGPFNDVARLGDRILLNYRSALPEADTLLLLDQSNTFQRYSPLYGMRNINLNVSANGEFVIVPHALDIHRYNVDLEEITFQFGYENTAPFPNQAIHGSDGAFWVADRELGLVRGEGFGEGRSIVPNGPRGASSVRMDSKEGVLFVSTGSVAGNWTNIFNKEGVHHYADGVWRTNDRDNTPLLIGANDFGEAMCDVMDVAVDPKDPTRAFAASWDEGLLEFKDRVPIRFVNASNSALEAELNGAPNKINTAGLDFDLDGNLWVTNASVPAVIKVYTTDGEWLSFTPGGILNGNFLVSDIVAASNGYKWVIRPRGNGLLVFNDNGTIDNTADDNYRLLNNIEGSGGLPSQDVFSVAEDKEGQVWVGTNRGVAVFFTPQSIFGTGNFDAQQILIEQDGNVQILLETETVTAIAVDGANRKWIGTQNSGVFLVSADGRQQLQRFTRLNSPLPSDAITSIAIDGASGEVFFGTERGILSYRSDATEGEFENTCASVYPNPVRDDHTGPIAITGLVRDSEVKITDIAGNLVYRTTSLGGQAVWPGTDLGGNRVATGVYLVMVADR
ncbi:MAG: two-component regulator propeller domain-containing protein, partial [Flavobacteriales bacterium]